MAKRKSTLTPVVTGYHDGDIIAVPSVEPMVRLKNGSLTGIEALYLVIYDEAFDQMVAEPITFRLASRFCRDKLRAALQAVRSPLFAPPYAVGDVPFRHKSPIGGF